jgi:hypothetical protein
MSKVLAEQKIDLEMDDYLKLLPHKHQTDGFFAAVLERKPMAPKKPKAERLSSPTTKLLKSKHRETAQMP